VYGFTDISPLAIVNTVNSKPTIHTVASFTVAGSLAGAICSVYTCQSPVGEDYNND
jgi:hypothetical protein